MTEKVEAMLNYVRSQKYRVERIANENYDMTWAREKHPLLYRTIMLEDFLGRETPYLLPGDIFGFNRRNIYCPHYYRDGKKCFGNEGNITPDYRGVMEKGFERILEEIDHYESINTDRATFYKAMRRDVAAVLDICERYRVCAEESGNRKLAEALLQVPSKPPRSFYEACLFFKIIIYTLRCANQSHITLGRFDQYMYSYFESDLRNGVSREALFETLELLFISLNVDSDIYYGIQQGDNGQSMVLGGFDRDGHDQFNELSRFCMEASFEINMIDPKINLRVSKRTPDEIYEQGTKLTKQGLGFPQYCNDDIIAPYMISMGYDEEDAYNYTVAACWEVISPNNGNDVPNKTSFILPAVVNRALYRSLASSESFAQFMTCVKGELEKEAEETIKNPPKCSRL